MTSTQLLPDSQVAELLSAREACEILKIKAATLYTYVSRGLLHPATHPGKKASRYLREEVERLRSRSDARMGHGAVAATAMRWGPPVIGTSITEITPDGPRYRGHLATFVHSGYRERPRFCSFFQQPVSQGTGGCIAVIARTAGQGFP